MSEYADGVVTYGEGSYPARWDPGCTWNGWLVPRFTLEVARQVLDDTAALDPGEVLEYTVEDRDGVTVLVVSDLQYHPLDEPEVLIPRADGLYPVGGFLWCWYETEGK
jgi:hypothetical protein